VINISKMTNTDRINYIPSNWYETCICMTPIN